MSLINEQQVVLDLMGADRHEATRTLAERLVASGRCKGGGALPRVTRVRYRGSARSSRGTASRAYSSDG